MMFVSAKRINILILKEESIPLLTEHSSCVEKGRYFMSDEKSWDFLFNETIKYLKIGGAGFCIEMMSGVIKIHSDGSGR